MTVYKFICLLCVVQASLTANTFAISGNCEDKRKPLLWLHTTVLIHPPPPPLMCKVCYIFILILRVCVCAAISELLPGIFNQLVGTHGVEGFSQLKKLTESLPTQETSGADVGDIDEDDEVPGVCGGGS